MKSTHLGFTLIEVMIVVVIVAILAAIAIPSYQEHMFEARRADAKESLLSIAGLQERHYLQNNEYADASDGVWSTESAEGYYSIALDDDFDCPGGSGEDNDRLRCFRLVASPAAGSPQRSDQACQAFMVDNIGRKAAEDSEGDDNSGQCW